MCVYTRNDYAVKSPALLDRVRLGPVTRWDLEFVDGDILIFSDGKSLVAGERYVDGLTKRGTVDGASYIKSSENCVTVYNRLPDLLLTLPKAKTAGTIIDINGSRYRLSDCESDEFESGDSRGVRAFLVPLSQFRECTANAENRVVIDAPGTPYAREYSFVYVPGLKAEFEGAPYVFEDRGTLVFPDESAPENISVELGEPVINEDNAEYSYTIKCDEPESRMMYYNAIRGKLDDVSPDDFADLKLWGNRDSVNDTLLLPADYSGSVVFRVYNNYGLYTDYETTVEAALKEEGGGGRGYRQRECGGKG